LFLKQPGLFLLQQLMLRVMLLIAEALRTLKLSVFIVGCAKFKQLIDIFPK